MKIALLTIWREKNYGAELQAYATVKLLQNFGHQVEMIDIRLSDCRKGNYNQKIYNLICGLTPGHRKFSRFWKKYIPVTKRYKTIDELQENPPDADVYMVGSDQVWNPDLTRDFSLLYFLNFGADGVRRVSFASSFGTTTWNHPELKDDVRLLLHRFNCLTCREKNGVLLLKKVFNVDSVNVIDPTLALGDYSDIIKGLVEKRTLVFYPLSPDSELKDFSERLSNELGLACVNNNARKKILGKLEWNRLGVEEWIRNIAEAQFIITRSYHGLIFSLIFQRNFAIITSRNSRNGRIVDLLDLIGLSDRLFESFDDLYSSRIWNKKIDYEKINGSIRTLRNQTLNELKRMVNL